MSIENERTKLHLFMKSTLFFKQWHPFKRILYKSVLLFLKKIQLKITYTKWVSVSSAAVFLLSVCWSVVSGVCVHSSGIEVFVWPLHLKKTNIYIWNVIKIHNHKLRISHSDSNFVRLLIFQWVKYKYKSSHSDRRRDWMQSVQFDWQKSYITPKTWWSY